jgi:hypothetical protein
LREPWRPGIPERPGVSTPVEAARFLGHCLSYDGSATAIADLRQLLSLGSIDWIQVIDIANRHAVAPAFWLGLKRKALTASLPADLRHYLEMLYDLNRRRNRLIREQALEASLHLERQGLNPVLMKGAIWLLEEDTDDGQFMMADVDILVAENDLAAGAKALRSLGYRLLDSPAPHAHGWTFYRPTSLVTIDLHRHVGPQRHILTPEAARNAAIPIADKHGLLLGLSPTHRALLLLMTFGIFERHYRNGDIAFKGLQDLATLCHRHGGRIDWSTIAEAAELYRFGASARAFLHLAHRLLAVPVPASLRESRMSRRYLRRCLWQLAMPSFNRAVQAWTYTTWPFDHFRMDYRYGCGLRGPSLHLARMRHAAGILARHNPFSRLRSPDPVSRIANNMDNL